MSLSAVAEGLMWKKRTSGDEWIEIIGKKEENTERLSGGRPVFGEGTIRAQRLSGDRRGE